MILEKTSINCSLTSMQKQWAVLGIKIEFMIKADNE